MLFFFFFLQQLQWLQRTRTREVSEQDERHHSQTLAAALQPRTGWAHSRGLFEPPERSINDGQPSRDVTATVQPLRLPEASAIYSPAVPWSKLESLTACNPVRVPDIRRLRWRVVNAVSVMCARFIDSHFNVSFRWSGRIMWRSSASWRSSTTLLTTPPSSATSLKWSR